MQLAPQINIIRSIHRQDDSYVSKINEIYGELCGVEMYYPDFQKWFFYKVLPDIATKRRAIISEVRNDRIVGLSILKLSEEEKKLSTLKVSNDHINSGIGLKLFQKSFEILDTEKPFLTVSEEKLIEFSKVFDYYGFKLTSVHESLYRKGEKEFFYNERN